ncbi:MAG: electron transfer flavoprotein subunit beta/FixA family protein [Spirochaetales bacterium]|nr:electron transfer flavoprotein subunit beta/FixA family protein [Spirochaetales bacterium]
MKIIVCIKQVPDTTDVKINPETNTLIREGVESIINPFDMYALEEGIRIKENKGGEVIALSMGPPQVEQSLREALSLGVDNVYLLSDRAFAGADTLATAYTLAAGINGLGGADIILMGKQAIDGDTGQVGPGVAENLGLPHVTDVRKIESIDEQGYIIVERLLEDGYVRLKLKLPVILTVVKEINEPRLPSLKGKMKARKAEVNMWTKNDLDVDGDRLGLTGSPTQVIKIFTPPKPSGGKVLRGEANEVVRGLLGELKQAGIPIGTKESD